MLKKFLFLSVLVGCIFSSKALQAQDIHYSQYYASPLTLNPALKENLMAIIGQRRSTEINGVT